MTFDAFTETFQRSPQVVTWAKDDNPLSSHYVAADQGEYAVTTKGLNWGSIWWCPRGHQNWFECHWTPSRRHPEPPPIEVPDALRRAGVPGGTESPPSQAPTTPVCAFRGCQRGAGRMTTNPVPATQAGGREDERIHVVQFSTGLASAEVAFRAVEAGHEVVLITADTTIEDYDNWRFAGQVHLALGTPEWVVLCDGRNPMEVGRDQKCIPNNRMAVCSRILKRELIRKYVDERWGNDPESILVLLGFDWTEPHRHDASAPFWKPYEVDSPLTRAPYWQKGDLDSWRQLRGIEPPRLYKTGAPHANCGGGCVRAGQVEWRRLLFSNRDGDHGYLWWEAEEEKSRELLGDYAIMRHRSGPKEGQALSLREFRESLEAEPSLFDDGDFGACGCDPFAA